MECGEAELGIVFVDDTAITPLNRQYFGRNRPTNVIAFPMGPAGPAPPTPKLLGEVVISVETARRQARKAGEAVEDEILYLLIHGILHLLGYDHEGSASERARMDQKALELFRRIRKDPRLKP